ncbi:glycosyltransferase [Sphingomonas sp. CJ99]
MLLNTAGRGGRPMRIGLLSAWASRLGGGVFEAVVGQGHAIAMQGGVPLLFALSDRFSDTDRHRFPGEVNAFPVIGPAQIGFAPALIPALLAADLDALHLHGIWMYPSRAAARWSARTGGRPVISPHGMLDPWITARGRAKKALARLGYERESWRRAALFHALTPAEADDIRRETGRAQVEVVANPVAAAEVVVDKPDPPYVLALGRIHPKKNLIGLIDGWHASSAAKAGWSLVIAGWGEPADMAAFEAHLAAKASSSIRFVGPAYGEDKARLLREARYLALPSFSEGLPLAIIEAWAAGTPTIHSAGCNLPQGFAEGASIETGTGAADIAAAIDAAVALDPARHRAMAQAAATLAARDYSLSAIGARWASIYASLGNGGAAA